MTQNWHECVAAWALGRIRGAPVLFEKLVHVVRSFSSNILVSLELHNHCANAQTANKVCS